VCRLNNASSDVVKNTERIQPDFGVTMFGRFLQIFARGRHLHSLNPAWSSVNHDETIGF